MPSSDVLLELEIRKWQDPGTSKFMLFVKVIRYQQIQSEIFVFQRDPLNNIDDFYHIASPANLTGFPKYNPGPGSPFFLDHHVELEFDSAKEREDTLGFMLIDIEKLKKDWQLVKDALDTTYNVII